MSLVEDPWSAPALRRWRRIRELGRGGMGVVYAAEDHDSGAKCAIKFIAPTTQFGPDALGVVDREIEIIEQLDHPNIVRCEAGGRVGDIRFFAMELCEQGSLRDLVLGQGPLPPATAVALTLDVLAGLAYLHGAPLNATDARSRPVQVSGLVHRDLKPANILITREGTAKVADFGLAKAFDLAGLSGLTHTGNTAGTPAFMPRQQVIDFKYVPPAADVWAAAACLYFMLTGDTPRDFPPGRDPWSVAWRTAPVPIAERGARLPEPLAALIDEALVDDPDMRFATAAELREALAQW